MAGQQPTSLPYPRRKTKSPNLSLGVPHNMAMTSQPRGGSPTANVDPRLHRPILSRLGVAAALLDLPHLCAEEDHSIQPMMITVQVCYVDESPYSVDIGEEDAGFAHPQLRLAQAAAKTLSE